MVSVKELTAEEIENLSMIQLAIKILEEEKKALDFQELFQRIADLKGLSEQERENKIAQFYTDLNIDGRFTTLGSNIWGLKRWYPVEQADEEVHTVKKKKKAAKKRILDDDDLVEEEDFLEDDLLDDEDLDLDEDDLDEDLDDDLDDPIEDEELDDEFDDEFDDDFEEIDEEFDEEEEFTDEEEEK